MKKHQTTRELISQSCSTETHQEVLPKQWILLGNFRYEYNALCDYNKTTIYKQAKILINKHNLVHI